jgi:hypothetical protein
MFIHKTVSRLLLCNYRLIIGQAYSESTRESIAVLSIAALGSLHIYDPYHAACRDRCRSRSICSPVPFAASVLARTQRELRRGRGGPWVGGDGMGVGGKAVYGDDG